MQICFIYPPLPERVTLTPLLSIDFDNILSNAIKYSPSGKTIKIKVDPDAPLDKNRNNGYTVIEIKDEGPGFSEADKARVFEEATRLSAVPTGGESSTGHGLYIARKLVIEMGGTIRLESISGNGSSFLWPLERQHNGLPLFGLVN